MKIEDTKASAAVVKVQGKTIPVGTVFQGTIGGHSRTFLMTYDGIVDLIDPENTYSQENTSVMDYRPRDAKVVLL